MGKGKVGLQKEISKIFTGIQIPKKQATETGAGPAAPAASAPAAAPAHYIPPKQTAASPKPFTIPEPENQQTSKPTAYQAPAPKPAVYEPPQTRQPAYEIPKPAEQFPSMPEIPPASIKEPKAESQTPGSIQILWLKASDWVKVKVLTPKHGVSPAKHKAMILLTPVLLVVFLIVVANVVLKPAGKNIKTTGKQSAVTGAAAFNGKINWEIPAPYPQNLRDPMTLGAITAQTTEQQEESGRPAVSGIVYSEDNPCAVVNGRIVSNGEVVDGVTVVKINPNSVEFAAGDKKWTQKVEN